MNTKQYLQAAKARLGITSDYALAARLGITRSGISQYQSGKNTMGDETALKIAEILGIDPGKVLLDMAVERSKSSEIQAVWAGLMEKFSMGFKSFISSSAPRHTYI